MPLTQDQEKTIQDLVDDRLDIEDAYAVDADAKDIDAYLIALLSSIQEEIESIEQELIIAKITYAHLEKYIMKDDILKAQAEKMEVI